MIRLLALLLLTFSFNAGAQTLSAATDGKRPATANAETQKFAGPIKLFDNLYYIGTDFVSSYLLVTSEGLIMLDTLYDGYTAEALAAIASLGYQADDIRYALVTHGHSDHAGGIAEVRAASGARIAMSANDWQLSGQEPDLVYGDGDTLTLGDTTIHFYLTPGHTSGVLSMLFTVRDGADEHTAFLFGGHNVTSDNPEDLQQFVATVERLQATLPEVEVNLTSHPWAALIFQRAALLEQRAPGDPHPFVDANDFRAFLAERLESTKARLAL